MHTNSAPFDWEYYAYPMPVYDALGTRMREGTGSPFPLYHKA